MESLLCHKFSVVKIVLIPNVTRNLKEVYVEPCMTPVHSMSVSVERVIKSCMGDVCLLEKVSTC